VDFPVPDGPSIATTPCNLPATGAPLRPAACGPRPSCRAGSHQRALRASHRRRGVVLPNSAR